MEVEKRDAPTKVHCDFAKDRVALPAVRIKAQDRNAPVHGDEAGGCEPQPE
ncbi:MAG: hypothetical protein QM761_07500 [Pseudoxanthomonas sp.]